MEEIKKPCRECPWTEKGQPLITEELRKTAEVGEWFCCHTKLGECTGAKNYGESKRRQKEPQSRDKKRCKTCGGELEVRANQFYYRGTYFTGLVCPPCNALFDNPDDSFMDFVRGKSAKNPG